MNMENDPNSLNAALRRARVASWMNHCRLLSLQHIVQKLAEDQGISELQGHPIKELCDNLPKQLSQRLLLEMEKTHPSGAAQLQQDLDTANWDWQE